MFLVFLVPFLAAGDRASERAHVEALVRTANDWRAPVVTRRNCIVEVVKKHIHPGMTLFDLARLLNHPTWLRDGDVCHWNNACGSFWIPVNITAEDSTFSIGLLPDEASPPAPAIFLRVSERITRAEFLSIVRGIKPDKDPVIREIHVD
jgi:hypothetical protein